MWGDFAVSRRGCGWARAAAAAAVATPRRGAGAPPPRATRVPGIRGPGCVAIATVTDASLVDMGEIVPARQAPM